MSRATLTGHYLAAPAAAVPAAFSVVAIFAPTEIDTTDGTIVSNLLVAETLGFLFRILPGDDLYLEAYSSDGTFTRTSAYNHSGLVGGGRVFCWGTCSGNTLRCGVGGPGSITPASGTFASGAIKTGTPSNGLTVWNRTTGARQLRGTQAQIGAWGSLLSDAVLDTGAASMNLETMPGRDFFEPRVRVRADAPVTDVGHMRDAAVPSRVWTPTGTGTDLTGAAL